MSDEQRISPTEKPEDLLVNPQFSPAGEQQPIGDNDFTNATNDISRRAKKTLGAYLSNRTKDNAYPVSAKSKLPDKVGHHGQELEQADSDEQKVFAPNDGTKQDFLSTGKQSFFTEKQASDLLSKTGAEEEKSGHTLLADVPERSAGLQRPEADGRGASKGLKLMQAVHDQLAAGNMFAPSEIEGKQPFLKDPNAKNEEEATRGLFTVQRNLGQFDHDGKVVKVSDMSAIAMSMMMRAVGNSAASEQILEHKALSAASLSMLAAFLDAERLGAAGVPIQRFRLDAVGTAHSPTAELAKSATGQKDFLQTVSNGNLLTKGSPPNNDGLPALQSTPINGGSYAQLNTFLEPFGGKFSSTSMIVAAVEGTLLMLGAAILFDAIGVLKSATKQLEPPRNPGAPNTLQYGSRNNAGVFAIAAMKMLEVTDTDYDFRSCVSLGVALLAGFPGFDAGEVIQSLKQASPQTMLAVAENLTLSAGYYANITRRLVAESTTVVGSFAKINLSSPAQANDSFLRAIEALTSSMTYKFVMIAAGLGDIALKAKFGAPAVGDNEKMLSKEQQKSLTPVGAEPPGVFRTRISRWGGSAGSTQALSLSTHLAAQKTPLLTSFVGKAGSGIRDLKPSADLVKTIEDKLEAEYMPFYIHDLRTHEILSMPAFIVDFSETFTANYNAVKGVGRQDPVRLYQDTERAVTLSFILAAMSEEDHDHLWMTINKFVAMCYPQYSMGRLREANFDDKTVQFVQPFSQVQAASPMVRLRLGDVFKSNYSKFGLSRLFGVQSQSKEGQAFQKLSLAMTTARERAMSKSSLFPSQEVILTAEAQGQDIFDENATSQKIGGKVCKIVSVMPGQAETLYNLLADDDTVYRVSASSIVGLTDAAIKNIVDTDPKVIEARNELANLQTSMPDPTFFDADSNAIVRSFESTRGRGVAGFITSLGLGYESNFPWEIKPGSRAPKIVKISMGFVPITDLPLGLDYDGQMRNPSHPVGKFGGSFGDVWDDTIGGKK